MSKRLTTLEKLQREEQRIIAKLERFNEFEVGGRKFFCQYKHTGPHSFRYFLEDQENPGKRENQPFVTIDRLDDSFDFDEVVARCGSRVKTFRDEDAHPENVLSWALGIDVKE